MNAKNVLCGPGKSKFDVLEIYIYIYCKAPRVGVTKLE